MDLLDGFYTQALSSKYAAVQGYLISEFEILITRISNIQILKN